MKEYGAVVEVGGACKKRDGISRTWSLALVLMVASALFAMVTFDPQGSSVELSEGLAKPDSSEPKMVNAAEYATATFANKDVSRAVLRAQQQAKAQYEAMMASALKAEAQAHKAGQKATEQSLAAQAKAEQMKIQQRRLRASADETRQETADYREQARINKELDRSLGTKVIMGQ